MPFDSKESPTNTTEQDHSRFLAGGEHTQFELKLPEPRRNDSDQFVLPLDVEGRTL